MPDPWQPPLGWPQQPPGQRTTNPALWVAAGVVAAVLLALAIGVGTSGGDSHASTSAAASTPAATAPVAMASPPSTANIAALLGPDCTSTYRQLDTLDMREQASCRYGDDDALIVTFDSAEQQRTTSAVLASLVRGVLLSGDRWTVGVSAAQAGRAHHQLAGLH